MKWVADWWGMQIQAETDEDKEILERLSQRISSKAEDYFQTGVFKVLKEEDLDETDHIAFRQLGKMTVQFQR